MASSARRIYTYHVVPRFDIAAIGGALQLGIVLNNLLELVPLNKNEIDRNPVPKDIIYTPVNQAGFCETREKLKSGNFGVWAQFLGSESLGAHVNGSRERSGEETVSCDNVVTTYFDPTGDWVDECLAVDSVKSYIVGSGYKSEVYIVTGLKVATNLTFGSEAALKGNVNAKMGVGTPNVPVAGLELGINSDKSRSLQFQSTDIVVGYRVKKYRYKRVHLLSRERKLDGKLATKGAQMLDDRPTDTPNKSSRYEEVLIEEEASAQLDTKDCEDPMKEYWVRPIKFSGIK
ncbi:hypothetical protein ABKA04_004792 [Annulohypoxylon sp. FPYF3050]